MPGCLRWRAHDAGRSPLRGGPDPRADRRDHRAAADSAGPPRCGTDEARCGRAGDRESGRAGETSEPETTRQEEPELMAIKPLLTKDFATEDLDQLSVYERTGGYTGFKRALEKQPHGLVEVGEKSGVRGRGRGGVSD